MYNFKVVFFLALVLAFLPITLVVTEVSAHGAGPPILSINNKLSDNNPIFTSSTDKVALGSDLAPENYVVNQTINFSLIRENLPAPEEVINRSTFHWDFGDGSKKNGLQVSHTYTNPGTFVVKMTVTDSVQGATFDLNTAQLNVLPNPEYQLPQAKIKANGKGITDPLKDYLVIKKGDTVEFDASDSSGENLTFIWDFGDGESTQGEKVTHTYNNDFFPIFPLLRVVDANNLAADAFVEIFDESGGQAGFPNPYYKAPTSSAEATSEANNELFSFAFLAVTLLVIVGGVVWVISKKRSAR